jgi:hypothetical protein
MLGLLNFKKQSLPQFYKQRLNTSYPLNNSHQHCGKRFGTEQVDNRCDMRREAIEYLRRQTEKRRELIKDSDALYLPDRNDPSIPKSIFQYNPVIWQEDGLYHSLFGRMPETGVWTLGTTPLESMQSFDKELKERLNRSGKSINDIERPRREEIHKEVFKKVDVILKRLLEG